MEKKEIRFDDIFDTIEISRMCSYQRVDMTDMNMGMT